MQITFSNGELEFHINYAYIEEIHIELEKKNLSYKCTKTKNNYFLFIVQKNNPSNELNINHYPVNEKTYINYYKKFKSNPSPVGNEKKMEGSTMNPSEQNTQKSNDKVKIEENMENKIDQKIEIFYNDTSSERIFMLLVKKHAKMIIKISLAIPLQRGKEV